MGGTESDKYKNSSIAVYLLAAMGMCLPSHCLATIGGIHMQIQRDNRGTVLKAVFSLWPDPMLYKEGSNIKAFEIMGDTQTHRQEGDLISLLSLFSK
jgi:hypothetical protein